MKQTFITAEPSMMGRRDVVLSGDWSVNICEFERGAPRTNISGKEMHVPGYDEMPSRCVRAHEMIHAKVSPANFEEWIKRGNATARAMVAVEEMRVNFLAQKLGYPVDEHLKDGGEAESGSIAARNDDWKSALLGAVACAESAAFDSFLYGVKKHKPEWVPVIKATVRKIRKTFSKASDLARTHDYMNYHGFRYTESCAAWLDMVGEEAEPKGDSEHLSLTKEDIEKMNPHKPAGEHGETSVPPCVAWGQLNVTTSVMLRKLSGSVSAKRRASDVGRNPRRLNRALTDPHRRIFDARRRTNGGVVLIDASGSMQFETDDIKAIVMASPGCLVAMYSENGDGKTGAPNLFIIAKDGKFVDEIPPHDNGNNIDLPALQWAVAQRKNIKDPVVWVTDGAVTATDGECYDVLTVECIQFCKKNDVYVAEDQPHALALMKQLVSGKRPQKTWTGYMKFCYLRLMKKELV